MAKQALVTALILHHFAGTNEPAALVANIKEKEERHSPASKSAHAKQSVFAKNQYHTPHHLPKNSSHKKNHR